MRTAKSATGAVVVIAAALLSSVMAACGGDSSDSPTAKRPNIVFLFTDDQRWDSMDQLPTMSAQRSEWARLENAYAEDPQCCPSRATALTGRHTSRTGVHTLQDGAKLDDSVTVGTMLEEAGYRTGLFGKYLNGYPLAGRALVPPGWDVFEANTGKINYDDYTLIENGTKRHYGSDTYPTDLLTEKALDFVEGTDSSTPFLLYLAYNAPHSTDHGPPEPAARDVGSCESEKFPLPPNFNSRDKNREPAWMARALPKDPASQVHWRRETCETLRGVDRSVAAIIDGLRDTGRLSNTYIVFTSDNGYGFGEHRLVGKGDLYDESARVPLWVRGPDVEPGSYDRLTSNIDLTPTFVDWAGASAPEDFLDGHSFAPALRGEDVEGPSAILLRGCRTPDSPEPAGNGVEACGAYPEPMGLNWGLRTERYKFIDSNNFARGESLQLFDLREDPWELTNLAYEPEHRDLVDQLSGQLAELKR